MSEPKRYSIFNPQEQENPTGAWVHYKDYAKLRDKIERLTKAGDGLAELMFIDKDYIGSPKQEAVIEWCKATEGNDNR